MSVEGTQKTVIVTELKQLQPDISEEAIKYVLDSIGLFSIERDALAAQISRMSTFIKLSAEKWKGVPEVEPTFWNLLRVANEAPQQHLREIQAEAGRAGYISACLTHLDEPMDWIDKRADQYADSIRNAKDGE